MHYSLLSLKMISFVLFPQATEPSVNFNIILPMGLISYQSSQSSKLSLVVIPVVPITLFIQFISVIPVILGFLWYSVGTPVVHKSVLFSKLVLLYVCIFGTILNNLACVIYVISNCHVAITCITGSIKVNKMITREYLSSAKEWTLELFSKWVLSPREMFQAPSDRNSCVVSIASFKLPNQNEILCKEL